MAFLPSDPRARTVCLATLANTFGNGVWLTGSALFLTRHVGLSAAEVGLALTIAGFVGVGAGIPVGRLADRGDLRLLRALAQLTQAVTVPPLLLVHSFGALLPLLCIEALASTANQVLRGALVASVAGRGSRVELWATLRAVANVGRGLGSLAAGLVIALGTAAYSAIPWLDFASFLLSAGYLIRVGPVHSLDPTTAQRPRAGPLRDRRFLGVVAVTSILLMGSELVVFPLPLWIDERTSAPTWFIAAIVIGVNVVGVFLTGWAKRGSNIFAASARRLRWGAALLGLGVAGFGLAAFGSAPVSVGLLILAAGCFAVGELVVAIRGSAMAFALSPDGQIGVYQGVANTGNTLAVACAPAAFAVLLLGRGTVGVLGWIAVGALFLVCGAVSLRLIPAEVTGQAVSPT